MICRVCPRCGGEWFSADTSPRPCAYCGKVLDGRHDRILVEVEADAGVKFLRQE